MSLVSFALFCKRNGTALRITEEDANPLSVYQKDWWLVLVNLESIAMR